MFYFLWIPELSTVSVTQGFVYPKYWNEGPRQSSMMNQAFFLIKFCAHGGPMRKTKQNKSKVIVQWDRQIGKEAITTQSSCFSNGTLSRVFWECQGGTAISEQSCHRRRWCFSGTRRMGGFSLGIQSWGGHSSNYRSPTTLLYNLVSLFPGWMKFSTTNSSYFSTLTSRFGHFSLQLCLSVLKTNLNNFLCLPN